MKESNPMPIRKFSLIGIIGLGLILLSLVLDLFNYSNEMLIVIKNYVVIISQVIGNILFGVALLGYFVHLKENKLLKWTSLIIGIFYLVNFFSVNNLFSLFYDEFGLFEEFSSSTFLVIYSFMVSVALIIFGYAFTKLGKVNRLIGIFAVLFIVCSVYVTSINIITTQVTQFLAEFEKEIKPIIIEDMLFKYQYFNVASYVFLLGIFIILFINQKGIYSKTFKVKYVPHVEEEENPEVSE